MASLVKQSSTQLGLKFFLVQSADHISALTGATPTVTICKEGGSFASPSGAVSEIANGWYVVAANATDTNTLGEILLHATAASADPTDLVVADVVAFDPTVATPANFGSLVINGSGAVSVQSNVKKNAGLNNFPFTMTDSTTHNPVTGKTVAVQVSLDGAAFVNATNTPATEVSNGDYKINLAAADTNANTVQIRFTATGCDDLNIILITDP